MTTNPNYNKMFIKWGNHIIYHATIQKPPQSITAMCFCIILVVIMCT